MDFYCNTFDTYERLKTTETGSGRLSIGGEKPIRFWSLKETSNNTFHVFDEAEKVLIGNMETMNPEEKEDNTASSKEGILKLVPVDIEQSEEIPEFLKKEMAFSSGIIIPLRPGLKSLYGIRNLVKNVNETSRTALPLLYQIDLSDFAQAESFLPLLSLLEDGIGDGIGILNKETSPAPYTFLQAAVRYFQRRKKWHHKSTDTKPALFYPPFSYQKRVVSKTIIPGGTDRPVIIADYSESQLSEANLSGIGYRFEPTTRQWKREENAADFLYTSQDYLPFDPPEGLKVLVNAQIYAHAPTKEKYVPLFTSGTWLRKLDPLSDKINFISIDCKQIPEEDWQTLLSEQNDTRVFCLFASGESAFQAVRKKINELVKKEIPVPIVLCVDSMESGLEEQRIHHFTGTGSLLLEGFGNGIWLNNHPDLTQEFMVAQAGIPEAVNKNEYLHQTALDILNGTDSLLKAPTGDR